MSAPPELARRLAAVRLVALDVDGVLTDGRVVYAGDQELQAFDVKDGAGLVALRSAGVEVVWITGRGCEATRRRAMATPRGTLSGRLRGAEASITFRSPSMRSDK